MRDIRHDLRVRLVKLDKERIELQRELCKVSDQMEAVRKMLSEEERIWKDGHPTLFDNPPSGRTGLAEALVTILRERSEPATLNELKDAATTSGISFGKKKPGRAVHFALIGMQQHGLVRRTADGRWKLEEESA